VLHFLGLRRCFDAVYGASAGAMNLTYFLSGQPVGARAYVEDLANERFINLYRLLPAKNKQPPRPALDLSILLEEVMGEIKPLNWDAVIQSPVPLKVVASNLDTMTAVTMQDFRDVDDLKMCLRASAAVPFVGGTMVEHRGLCMVDAAVFEGIPLPSAMEDGCTHVLALCTQSRPELENEAKLTRKRKVLRQLGAMVSQAVKSIVLNPPYMKGVWDVVDQRDREGTGDELTLNMLVQGTDAPYPKIDYGPSEGSYVLAVFPDKEATGGADISPLCIDPELMQTGLDAGMGSLASVLEPVTHAQDDEDKPGSGQVAQLLSLLGRIRVPNMSN